MKTQWIRRAASLGFAFLCSFLCTFGAFEAHAQDSGLASETETIVISSGAGPERINDALKIAGWTTLGVGVATLVTAGVMTGLQHDLNESLNYSILNAVKYSELGAEPNILYKGIFKDKSIFDANTLGNRLQTTNVVLWSVGGGLTAVGVVLTCLGYLYDFGSDSALSGLPAVNFAVTPEYQGMSLGWRF